MTVLRVFCSRTLHIFTLPNCTWTHDVDQNYADDDSGNWRQWACLL